VGIEEGPHVRRLLHLGDPLVAALDLGHPVARLS